MSPVKLGQGLREILDRAQYKKRPSITLSQDESESSGDEHLIDPNKVDLSSSYFQENNDKSQTGKQSPKFDCNVGCLSDSDDEDVDDDQDSTNIKSDNKKLELESFDSFNKKIEDAKEMLKNYNKRHKEDSIIEEATVSTDVTALLALGESKPAVVASPKKEPKLSQKRKKHHRDDSEDDWEEVDGKRIKTKLKG